MNKLIFNYFNNQFQHKQYFPTTKLHFWFWQSFISQFGVRKLNYYSIERGPTETTTTFSTRNFQNSTSPRFCLNVGLSENTSWNSGFSQNTSHSLQVDIDRLWFSKWQATFKLIMFEWCRKVSEKVWNMKTSNISI